MSFQKDFFQLTYDGPSLESHEMDVRDLAPALLAVSDLLEEANLVIYGNSTTIQVNVKGSFKTGSFNIDFSVAQSIINQLVDLFNSDGVNAGSNILSLLGFTGVGPGLIYVLKKLKNKKIKKISKTEGSKVIIEVEDDKIETEEKVIQLLQNIKIRQSLDLIISRPLEKEGVNDFYVNYSGNVTNVNKSEREYFATPVISDELLDDKVYETNLQILSISFSEGNKWKFTDGNVSFFATVKDTAFIDRVQRNEEAFAKDDILKVSLRQRQWVGDAGIKTEYEVEKIISHRHAAKQINLPFENEED